MSLSQMKRNACAGAVVICFLNGTLSGTHLSLQMTEIFFEKEIDYENECVDDEAEIDPSLGES